MAQREHDLQLKTEFSITFVVHALYYKVPDKEQAGVQLCKCLEGNKSNTFSINDYN